MTDCIFCKIVSGEMPCYTIYDDDTFMAFLDVFPKSSGQILVIPKEHIEWVWDVPQLGAYYELVGTIARHVRAVSGQPVRQMVFGFQVPHAHIQLRPGREDDLEGGKAQEQDLIRWRETYSLI